MVREPDAPQLSARDDAVLRPDEARDRLIDRGRDEFWRTIRRFSSCSRHAGECGGARVPCLARFAPTLRTPRDDGRIGEGFTIFDLQAAGSERSRRGRSFCAPTTRSAASPCPPGATRW
jgi:hypothetical protein